MVKSTSPLSFQQLASLSFATGSQMAGASIIMTVTEMWGVGMAGCQERRNNPKSEGMTH